MGLEISVEMIIILLIRMVKVVSIGLTKTVMGMMIGMMAFGRKKNFKKFLLLLLLLLFCCCPFSYHSPYMH